MWGPLVFAWDMYVKHVCGCICLEHSCMNHIKAGIPRRRLAIAGPAAQLVWYCTTACCIKLQQKYWHAPTPHGPRSLCLCVKFSVRVDTVLVWCVVLICTHLWVCLVPCLCNAGQQRRGWPVLWDVISLEFWATLKLQELRESHRVLQPNIKV